jgi:uncharacterized protein
MSSFFLDTSYVVALELSAEQYHSSAVSHWQTVVKAPFKIITTSYVFDEIVTFFNNRGHHDRAVEVGNRLLNSAYVEMLQVDETLFLEGWQYFQQHTDKSYSLTDCISFLVMQKRNISTALTFDLHFSQAGLQKLP